MGKHVMKVASVMMEKTVQVILDCALQSALRV